ncbi:hypothetical protein AVEN_220503-1 [Araneus ventricosus]|uniref:Uncharacterized protein n=1 Tax=Araneus ventricosus TaxID=182803 RepID=A0A4Y2KZI8_ARAVE|nr:hypothetical protein AVEN_220503-1 [Araneus ventricosus]
MWGRKLGGQPREGAFSELFTTTLTTISIYLTSPHREAKVYHFLSSGAINLPQNVVKNLRTVTKCQRDGTPAHFLSIVKNCVDIAFLIRWTGCGVPVAT